MFDRRHILKLSLAASALNVSAVGVAFASPVTDRRFVVVILRGGLDGLTAVPPVGDPDYAGIRGPLAIDRTQALELDATFGLHPALAHMHDLWSAKELAVFHAIASPYRERSHFDAQDVLETGGTRPHGLNDGWLNRALPGLGLGDGGHALAVAETAPLILLGKARTTSWMPQKAANPDDEYFARLRMLYARDPVLGQALDQALKTEAAAVAAMDDHGQANAPPVVPAADAMAGDPTTTMAARTKAAGNLVALTTGAGKLLAAPDGPRIAVLDFSGWDTHVQEGAAEGVLARRLAALDGALGALKDSLGPVWKQTAVVVATEFGRTVAPNGSRGTDHGTGTVAFLMGGSVAGGKVRASWDGLRTGALYEGRDVQPRTDLRSLFKAGLTDHLHLSRAAMEGSVFPDSSAVAPLSGLFKA